MLALKTMCTGFFMDDEAAITIWEEKLNMKKAGYVKGEITCEHMKHSNFALQLDTFQLCQGWYKNKTSHY